MIFKQALQRELSRTFTATLVVLVTIVMTMMLIRTLGMASKGSVNPQEVFLVMAYSVLGHIPTILTLSLFITLVSTLGRMKRDSEMVVWLTSGQSFIRFLRPLFTFALPLIVTIAALALLIWPWTNAQMQDLRTRFEQRGDLERITPGQFQESASGERVFYIDKVAMQSKIDATTQLPMIESAQNIFIASFEHDKESITAARTGKIETQEAEKYLILEEGQRLERDVRGGQFKLTQFQTLGTRIGQERGLNAQDEPKALTTLTLVRNPSALNKGELAWRLGLALAAINFVLLSLALSGLNPRAGRGSHLGFALLAFVFYYNMINVSQAWISAGRADVLVTLVALHGSIFAVCLLWLILKDRRISA